MEITEIFKALSDNTRLRMVNIIKAGGTLCNCDIEAVLDISQVNASRHLSKLKSTKLIKAEKKSQWVYYSLNEEFVNKYSFIKELLEKNRYEDIMEQDIEKLEAYLKNKVKC